MSPPEPTDTPSSFQPTQWAYDQPGARRPPGTTPANAGLDDRTAFDVKELHGLLPQFTGDELRQIAVLPLGTSLTEGETYLDLRHLEEGEFTAHAGQAAGPDDLYVAKHAVDYRIWNRLRGINGDRDRPLH